MFPKYQHQLFYHCLGCCNFMSVKTNSLRNLQYFNGWVLIKPHFMRGSSLKFALIKTFLRQPELLGRVSIHEMGTGRGLEGRKAAGGVMATWHKASGQKADTGTPAAVGIPSKMPVQQPTVLPEAGRDGRPVWGSMAWAEQGSVAMQWFWEGRKEVCEHRRGMRGERGLLLHSFCSEGDKPQGRQVKDVRLHRGSTAGRDTCKNRNEVILLRKSRDVSLQLTEIKSAFFGTLKNAARRLQQRTYG